MTLDEPGPRRRHPRVPLAAAMGIALIAGVGGYAVGHGRTSGRTADPAASTSACDRARVALDRQNATASASPGNKAVLRVTANLVVANSTCFDPQVVAASQAFLDQLAQGG